MQSKLVPQDLDLLRIKIQEELEAPHQMKVAELEGEIRKWETLFYSVRRAYEKDKAEHELFREQMQVSEILVCTLSTAPRYEFPNRCRQGIKQPVKIINFNLKCLLEAPRHPPLPLPGAQRSGGAHGARDNQFKQFILF